MDFSKISKQIFCFVIFSEGRVIGVLLKFLDDLCRGHRPRSGRWAHQSIQ